MENCHTEYSLEVDVQYSKKTYEFHNVLTYLSERMKIENNEKLALEKGIYCTDKNFQKNTNS